MGNEQIIEEAIKNAKTFDDLQKAWELAALIENKQAEVTDENLEKVKAAKNVNQLKEALAEAGIGDAGRLHAGHYRCTLDVPAEQAKMQQDRIRHAAKVAERKPQHLKEGGDAGSLFESMKSGNRNYINR